VCHWTYPRRSPRRGFFHAEGPQSARNGYSRLIVEAASRESPGGATLIGIARSYGVSCSLYYEAEPGRRAAANLLTRDEARRIAANIAGVGAEGLRR
jgi:hypothetical protein